MRTVKPITGESAGVLSELSTTARCGNLSYSRSFTYFVARSVLTTTASGRYDEVVRLQETLCDVKRQFQELQLKEVEKDQMRQSSLYQAAQKVCVCV